MSYEYKKGLINVRAGSGRHTLGKTTPVAFRTKIQALAVKIGSLKAQMDQEGRALLALCVSVLVALGPGAPHPQSLGPQAALFVINA